MELKIRLGGFEPNEEHQKLVNTVLSSGRITENKYTRKFEDDFAKYVGTKECISCTNGTAGLMLVFKALQIMKGRPLTFLVPSTTFPATLNAIILTGNKAVLCDVGRDLLIKIDENKLKGIDGIVPVHLFGYSCDMNTIMELKKKYNLLVVEDVCEATGGTYHNHKLGGFGDAGVFSFFMGHCVGVGELGAITTDNKKLSEIIRSLKNHGRVGSPMEFNHKFQGYNFKTTEFMTALAWNEIPHIDSIMKKRFSVALSYFGGIINPKLKHFSWSNQCSYLGYPLLASSLKQRGDIIRKINLAGIETRTMFPNLANQEAYSIKNKFPMSDYFENHAFYIPCHQYLTQEEIQYVIKTINEA